MSFRSSRGFRRLGPPLLTQEISKKSMLRDVVIAERLVGHRPSSGWSPFLRKAKGGGKVIKRTIELIEEGKLVLGSRTASAFERIPIRTRFRLSRGRATRHTSAQGRYLMVPVVLAGGPLTVRIVI